MKNSSKLERFNSTLNDLEGELVKLRETSKAYVKLKELSSSYKLILDQFEQNSFALQDLAKKQVAKHHEIKKSLDKQIDLLNLQHKKTSNMILIFGIISVLLLIGILVKQFM